VHVRHLSDRLDQADAPFPSGTRESEWRLTRSRHSSDVNAKVREALDQDDYSLFRTGLLLLRNSHLMKRSLA
jgi:hypothetical protein